MQVSSKLVVIVQGSLLLLLHQSIQPNSNAEAQGTVAAQHNVPAVPGEGARQDLVQNLDGRIRAIMQRGKEQRRQCKFEDAETSFKEAYRIANSPSSQVEPLEGLGGLYLDLGRLDESESLYRKALQNLDQAGEQDAEKRAAICDNLSNVCLAKGKLGESLEFNKRALDIYEASKSMSAIDLAKCLNQSGLILGAQRNFPQAQVSFKRAIELLNGANTNESRIVLSTAMDNLGGAYLKSGQLDEAEKVRKQAMQNLEGVLGPSNPDLAKSLMNLAAVYGAQKKWGQALPLLKRAEQIDETALGLHNPTTIKILRNYVLVLKLTHRDEELAKLEARVSH